MSRTPVDVYSGLLRTGLEKSIPTQIETVVSRFTDSQFVEEKISVHLTRFIRLFTRLVGYLDGREVATLSDVTVAIDVLDYFTSSSKWWQMSRNDPGFVLRPPSREPREFIKSIADLQLSGPSLQRASVAADKLSRFLEEHELATPRLRKELREDILSSWVLLSAFSCKAQGRNVTTEADFETGYDIVRILLFYVPLEDFTTLTAIRRLGTHTLLPQAASVGFSPGFDRKLNSSVAANLEKVHEEHLAEMASSTSGASRTLLTNSLRLLGQIQAVRKGLNRLEAEHYDSTIVGALEMFEKVGISSEFLQDESAAVEIFQGLRPAEGVEERIQLLTRRLEGLVVDSTGNKDFLLQYARLVPRLVALLLLLASKAKVSSDSPLTDLDLKRGVILLNYLISD
ncbi:MAG: hypothetical protein ACFFE6_01685 [Candidatus Thorarchaeota archaeon]